MIEREEIIRQARVRQSIDELRRKQRKAMQRGLYTQEDIDLADAEAKVLFKKLRRDRPTSGGSDE